MRPINNFPNSKVLFYSPTAPPALRAAAFDDAVPEHLTAELLGLVPLYRFTAWSKESDFLFSS